MKPIKHIFLTSLMIGAIFSCRAMAEESGLVAAGAEETAVEKVGDSVTPEPTQVALASETPPNSVPDHPGVFTSPDFVKLKAGQGYHCAFGDEDRAFSTISIDKKIVLKVAKEACLAKSAAPGKCKLLGCYASELPKPKKVAKVKKPAAPARERHVNPFGLDKSVTHYRAIDGCDYYSNGLRACKTATDGRTSYSNGDSSHVGIDGTTYYSSGLRSYKSPADGCTHFSNGKIICN